MLDWAQKSARGWGISVRGWQQRSGQCCTVLMPGTRSSLGWQPPAQPSLCLQPPPVTGIPWLQDTGLAAANAPSQSSAEPLSALCPLPADNKPWAPAQTGCLPICWVCVDAKGLATSQVATPREESLLQNIETTLLLDLRPGNFLPQFSGLGDSVTDPTLECHRPFTPLYPLKPPPAHQTFSPSRSHTHTPTSSLPPWASFPFPKACSTLVMTQITPSPCDPCPSPCPCPMCFLPSFLELLPVHPPHSLWSHSLHPWASTYLTWEGRGHLPELSPMSSSAHPRVDVLSSTVWLWPPFRAFLLAVAVGQHQAEDAPHSPLKAMGPWSLKIKEIFAIVQVWKNQQTRETFILGIKVYGQLMFAFPSGKFAWN